jgi:hypothetical protein
MKSLIADVVRARKAGVPFVAVGTPDQPAVANAIADAMNGSAPTLSWDGSRGLTAVSDSAVAMIASMVTGNLTVEATAVPGVMWSDQVAGRLPKGCVLVAHNLQRYLGDPGVLQGVLNLRDHYKQDFRVLVLMSAATDLPAELRGDVVPLEDPLPDDQGYAAILAELYQAAEYDDPPAELADAAVRAVRGVSAFQAEQILAMSLDGKTKAVDVARVWAHKREAVNQVRGLDMILDGPPLDSVLGLDGIVSVYRRLFEGPRRPEAVLLLDEMDKMMAGAGHEGPGDNTGVAQDAHGQLLDAMERYGWTGSVLVGIPGAGKTLFASAIGAAYGAPLIRMDLGGMHQPHLGASEQAIREALRVVRSVGRDRVAVLGTCNKLSALPPEFQRRFRLQTWFFDVATEVERRQMFNYYLAKYFGAGPRRVTAEKWAYLLEHTEGWTGAEVRNACEIAYALAMPIDEAVGYVVPVAKSNPQSVEALRNLAESKFLSASTGRPWQRVMAAPKVVRRKMEVS